MYDKQRNCMFSGIILCLHRLMCYFVFCSRAQHPCVTPSANRSALLQVLVPCDLAAGSITRDRESF